MENKQTSKKDLTLNEILENVDSYSEEELKEVITLLAEKLQKKDETIFKLIAQARMQNTRMYGRKTDQRDVLVEQMQLEFNELESVEGPFTEEPEVVEKVSKPKKKKRKRVEVLPDFETHIELTINELNENYGKGLWQELPSEVSFKAHYQPSKITYEKIVRHKYRLNDNETIVRAPLPNRLLPKSLATPSLVSHIVVSKYVNAVPLYRLQKDFKQHGLRIERATMCNWLNTIYQNDLYKCIDYMHKELMKENIICADETPVQVNKDGRATSTKSYMWVYRTNESKESKQIVLYDYQKTREAQHPIEFLEDYKGIIVCDGYSGYETTAKELDGVVLQRCWVHTKRKVADIIKSSPKGKVPEMAFKYSEHISNLFHKYNLLTNSETYKKMNDEEKVDKLHKDIKPIVDEFFAFINENIDTLPASSKTGAAFRYALNQEDTLRTFLDHPGVPLDSNAAERSIRPFTIGRNYVLN